MIEVRELVKTFDGFRALDGVSLTVSPGSVYGLVGPNGAGKSTTIRHLAGIYRQDSGQVLIDGQPVYENRELKSRLAYIPDDVFYYSQATLADVRDFYKSIYPRFDSARFNELIDVFEIDPRRVIRRLSKGMQKQAAFQLALCLRPEIVILDEPVDGLDPIMRRRVWGLLLDEMSREGLTVLVSSHNLRELEDVCDHVGIMNRGKMLLERSLAQLQDNLVKIQLAYPDGGVLPNGLDILNQSSTGRLQQLILRGDSKEITEILAQTNPLFVDIVPLTLEEIFIFEIGDACSEVKDAVI